MCVIILAEHARPDQKMLESAWAMNRDGGGMAHREPNPENPAEMQVVWQKALNLAEIIELSQELPLPYVIHMRIASVDGGGVRPALTHPFEVSAEASIDLMGRTTNPVLFHNGNWKGWEERALEAAIRSNIGVPTGWWNDSRAIAWLSHVCGWGFMNFLPEQRGLIFAPTWYNTFSGPGWVKHKDSHDNEFWCSNNRPWTQSYKYENHAVCKYGQCRRHDLDSKGYCPDHINGREKLILPIAAPGGAAATNPPFPAQGPHQPVPLTLELAEKFFANGKISQQMIMGIRKIYERLGSKNQAVVNRAQKNLAHVQRAVAVQRALEAE